MNRLKEIGGDIFIVAFGVFMLWCFVTIYTKGGVMFAVEPNLAVLALEILATVVIVVWGLERFVDDLRSKK